MRQVKKASDVMVGDDVIPPLSAQSEKVVSVFQPQEGATNPYVTIITSVRKWFIAPTEDVALEVLDVPA